MNLRRCLLAFLILCVAGAHGAAAAQPIELKAVPEMADMQTLWRVAVLPKTDNMAQLLSPSAPVVTWQPQTAEPSRLAADQALWLRLELAAFEETPKPRILRLTVAGLDSVEAFRIEKGEVVLQEASGDSISTTAWPIWGRYPAFEIAPLQWEPVTYYFKITHTGPLSIAGVLASPNETAQDQLREALQFGLFFGGLLLMGCLGIAGALWYRNAAFFGFSAYALSNAALFLSASGLLGQFWTQAPPTWIHTAPYLLTLLTAALGLLHYMGAVSLRQLSRWRFVSLLLTCALGAGVAVLVVMRPLWGQYALTVYAVVCAVQAVLTLMYAMSKEEPWVPMHFVSLATYLLAAAFPLAEALGLARMSSTVFQVTSLMCVLSLGVTFFALNSKVRELTESSVRLDASAMADPLTGVANYRRLVMRFHGVFSRARHHKHFGALLLVDVRNLAEFRQHAGQLGQEAALVRTAVIIRSRIKNIDLVSRVSDHHFAVALEGPMNAKSVTDIAAKMIAAGLRPSASAPCLALDLSICIDFVPRQSEDVAGLLHAAQNKLRKMPEHDQRRIVFMIDNAAPPKMAV